MEWWKRTRTGGMECWPPARSGTILRLGEKRSRRLKYSIRLWHKSLRIHTQRSVCFALYVSFKRRNAPNPGHYPGAFFSGKFLSLLPLPMTVSYSSSDFFSDKPTHFALGCGDENNRKAQHRQCKENS